MNTNIYYSLCLKNIFNYCKTIFEYKKTDGIIKFLHSFYLKNIIMTDSQEFENLRIIINNIIDNRKNKLL